MTELLYQRDAYESEFDAEVVTVSDDGGVILDRTCFYPGGGGQPHDTGLLSFGDWQASVVRVSRGPDGVLHSVEGEPPSVGSRVHGTLDWDRRYALMRTHTALHILCGVVWRDYGAQVTGGNMEPGKGRLDFEFESLNTALVGEIEEKLNIEVAAARDIRVDILPRAKAFEIPDLIRTKINLLPEQIQEVRVVEIVGLDLQADGGTHVANTREVGALRIVSHKSKGRINKRIVVGLE